MSQNKSNAEQGNHSHQNDTVNVANHLHKDDESNYTHAIKPLTITMNT